MFIISDERGASVFSLQWEFDVRQPFLGSFQLQQQSANRCANENSSCQNGFDSSTGWATDLDSAMLIPAVDGSIFAYDQYSVQKLPRTVKQLVEQSPFSDTESSTIVTGKSSATMFGVDMETGKVKAVFPPGEDEDTVCREHGNLGSCEDNGDNEGENLLWLTQKHYNVRAFRRMGGMPNTEIWNFTVGDILAPQITIGWQGTPPVEK